MRIEALSFFRFPAALLVAVFHVGHSSGLVKVFPGMISWHPIVLYFFVLSGFVNTIAYYKRENFSVPNYWLNRFARIYPLYFLAFLLSLLVIHLEIGIEHTARIGKVIFLNVTFLKIWYPSFVNTLNTPSWAMATEMFFYLTFPPILFWLNKKERKPSLVIWTALAIWFTMQIIHMVLGNSSLSMSDSMLVVYLLRYCPITHTVSFIIGVAAGYYFLKRRDSITMPQGIRYLLLIAVFVVILVLNHYKDRISPLVGFNIEYFGVLFAPLWGLFIIALSLLKDSIISKILSRKFFAILGDSSYGIFILQEPVYRLLRKFVFPVTGLSDGNNFYLFLVCLIGISIITFYIVEQPCRKLIVAAPGFFRKLFSRKKREDTQ